MPSKSSAPQAGGYVAPGSQPAPDPGPMPSMTDHDAFQRWAAAWQASRSGSPTAYQQAAEATARSNHPNQYSPFASSEWQMNPDGTFTQHTGFAGPLAGAASGLEGQAADALGSPLDFSKFGAISDGSAARQHAEDAIYGRETSRLDPMWKQREESARADLANEGLDPDSEAGQKRLSQLGRDRNDAYSNAMRDAITGGGAEASRQMGLDMTARNQGIREALMRRDMPLEELGQLRGFLGQPGAMPGANYLAATEAYNNYNLGATQMNNQNAADFWAGLMKIPSGFASGYGYGSGAPAAAAG